MREIRQSGSEGGGGQNQSSLPTLSDALFTQSLPWVGLAPVASASLFRNHPSQSLTINYTRLSVSGRLMRKDSRGGSQYPEASEHGPAEARRPDLA